MAKVRLGFADVALARPLTWALLKGEHAEVFKTTVLPHRRVAPLLAEGALDVGLVTEAELERFDLKAIPDLAVVLVADGGAAVLESAGAGAADCPGCEQAAGRVLERLALSEGDVASQAQARIDFGSQDLGADGVAADLGRTYADLFEEEPVLYVWAHRSGFDPGAAEFALKSSLRFGLSGLEALARELASERSTSAAAVERLLRTGVRFVRPVRGHRS